MIIDPAEFFIFDEFRATISRVHQRGYDEDYRYSYEVINVAPATDGFRIINHTEINNGLIPLFDTPDFYGIGRKITELYKFYRKSFIFAYLQLKNIGLMLLSMIDTSNIGEAPIPRAMTIPRPYHVREYGGRIILNGRTREIDFGYMSLSILPNGSVKYWFKRDNSEVLTENDPVYRDLRINFPSPPK